MLPYSVVVAPGSRLRVLMDSGVIVTTPVYENEMN